LIKERCTLLTDFWPQGSFFFIAPVEIDKISILSKWDDKKNQFFAELISAYSLINNWDATGTEKIFKEMAAASQIKAGELMMPLRVMLVGQKFGPGVFEIASVLGKEETIKRIEHALSLLK
jgi:glutamyl-tRNA synthetase